MNIVQKKKLSFLLAMLLVFLSVAHFVTPVRAQDPEHNDETITGITYTWDGNVYVGSVDSSVAESEISVPEGYHLVMSDEAGDNHLSGTTVSITSGGSFEIGGAASFAGTVNPNEGAFIRFQGTDNVPNGLALYAADGENAFADTENIGGHTFIYTGGKWTDYVEESEDNEPDTSENDELDTSGNGDFDVSENGEIDTTEDEENVLINRAPNEPDSGLTDDPEEPLTEYYVGLNLGGFNPSTDTITIEYKYTNNGNYAESDFDLGDEDPNCPGNYYTAFVLSNLPENWNYTVYLQVTFSTQALKRMAMVDYGAGEDIYEELSNGINGDGTVFTTTLTLDANNWNWIGVSLAFTDSGNPAITEEVNNYLYAYCPTAGKTVKELFAEGLFCRFIDPPIFENFGIGEVAALVDRIEESGAAYQITAKDTAGNNSNIVVQNYTINWGYSYEDGSRVSCVIPVYTLGAVNETLVCTDFNDATGTGNTFLICNLASDNINFCDGTREHAEGIMFAVNSINPATVKTGGMGRRETVLNDEGLYTVEITGGGAAYLRFTNPQSADAKIRFLKISEKYVTVKGVGENKSYGHIGDNGRFCDTIWATGNNANSVARVYVGDTTIHLYPLGNQTGSLSAEITSVELVNSSQADGVTLTVTDMTDITLSFASNFYDEVPLKITFAGGTVKYITISRVGLVIQYRFLDGSPDFQEDNSSSIGLDYCGQNIHFDYDYFGGEQIAIWATYYHPTNDPTGGAGSYKLYLTFNDGSHQILTSTDSAHGFNGSVSATGSAVGSTTFLIGFEQAREYFDGNVWIGQLNETNFRRGGFYATVLNDGFDDSTTYSGTQIGSGKGVYWDGHITFY